MRASPQKCPHPHRLECLCPSPRRSLVVHFLFRGQINIHGANHIYLFIKGPAEPARSCRTCHLTHYFFFHFSDSPHSLIPFPSSHPPPNIHLSAPSVFTSYQPLPRKQWPSSLVPGRCMVGKNPQGLVVGGWEAHNFPCMPQPTLFPLPPDNPHILSPLSYFLLLSRLSTYLLSASSLQLYLSFIYIICTHLSPG